MIIKRLVTVIRSNLNSGTSTIVHNDLPNGATQASSSETNEEPLGKVSVENITDKERIRELQYLSNLELQEGADFAEIKASYRKLLKLYHPDKFHGDEEKQKYAEEVSTRLNEAYAYFEIKHSHQSI